ncbi:MAG: hypothetical protein PVS3B1_37360 [Ktedonobacteraceae bacterium]
MSDRPELPVSEGLEDAPGSIFISYSREDKNYLKELHVHLAHYVREGAVVYWDDTKILPGSRWKNELNDALRTAKIALFLVSANFFASDFIYDHEMGPLLRASQEKGVEVLSVVLGACAFKDSELSKFQAVNAPSEPLNQMSRGKRDVVWEKVARRCRDILAKNKKHV